jgi:hypothetical protein
MPEKINNWHRRGHFLILLCMFGEQMEEFGFFSFGCGKTIQFSD